MASIYPISIEQTLIQKLQNFSEAVYTLNPTDHLTKFMAAVLGPSGTGQLAQVQGSARASQNLSNIQFFDLDTILGSLLGVSRTQSEEYPVSGNPFIDQIVTENWNTIYANDAAYRERLKLCLQGIQRGGTLLGIQMLAEGLGGISFCVIPGWQSQYVEGARFPGNPNEVILIPQFTPDISSTSTAWLEARQAVYTGLQNLKPANTLITIVDSVSAYNAVSTRMAVADSEWFEMDRQVISTNGVINPTTNSNSRYWLQPSNGVSSVVVDAPTFTGLQFQDLDIDVTGNIKTISIQVLTYLNNQPPIPMNYNPSNVLINSVPSNLWQAFGRADSPDNFPGQLVFNSITAQNYWIWGSNGPAPYGSDATHYNSTGSYIYSWPSQAEFIAAETASIEAQGGVVNAAGTAFYLPPTSSFQPSTNVIQPSNYDMIQATQIPVFSTAYGGQ